MPLLAVLVSPNSLLVPIVSAASLLFLALLGAIGARAGGRECPARHRARNVLGRVGHGAHGRHRCVVWDSGLKCGFAKTLGTPTRGASTLCRSRPRRGCRYRRPRRSGWSSRGLSASGLLDIEVHELARPLALIAANRHRRLQALEPPDPASLQLGGHGRAGKVELLRGDLLGGQPIRPPQPLHQVDPGIGRAVSNRVWP